MPAAKNRPLGLDDVADLLARSPSTRETILVGGQALNVLAVHYGLDVVSTAVSEDIDFFGDARQARAAGQAWNGATRIARIDDHTPNSAYVLLEMNGATYQIDFMADILGVKVKELKDWAATIEADGKAFLVMHPLHVLQSQLENIYGILNRRSMGARAVKRMRLANSVAASALADYLEHGDIKTALKGAERIAKIATTPAGLRAWYEDHVDVLAAIPENPHWSRVFLTKRLPQIHKFVDSKRENYSARQDRGSNPPSQRKAPS
ncbi:MAG TPA: hypothetical protein VGO35_00505 [Gammaproteobacteria bacterium]|jgi:hypothetical protein|nr:hypothetical protein [Gammaproteobacteria bacterium]